MVLSERTGIPVYPDQVVLKTLWNQSLAITSLLTMDWGTTCKIHLLSGVFTPRTGNNQSENFHKLRMFTRDVLCPLLALLERTIHKGDTFGIWSQMVVKQLRIRGGILVVTNVYLLQPFGDGTSDRGLSWNSTCWTELDWRLLELFSVKIRSNYFSGQMRFFKITLLPPMCSGLKENCDNVTSLLINLH